MNSVLQQFYTDIQAWIEAEFPSHEVFKEDSGLCSTLERYLTSRGVTWVYDHPAYLELNSQFTEEGLHNRLPFNTGGEQRDYFSEFVTRSIYKNHLRLAWIRRHANSSIGLRG